MRTISTPLTRRAVMEATSSPRASFSFTGLRTRSTLLQRRERRRDALGQRRALHVEHHRDERVVAADADEVHHAALAEALERRLVRVVADFLLLVQLLAEVVDDDLLGLHAERALALRERGDRRRLDARLRRVLRVRVPLVLRAPVARGDEDRELVERRRQRAA